MTQKTSRCAAFWGMACVFAAIGLMGCSAEKQYPGGDNDDTRKAPAASAAPPTAAPAADTSREKPGSGDAGGK